MKSTARLALYMVTTLAIGSSIRAGEPVDSCLPEYAAAALVANLYDISMTTGELELLNGTENPRLRRSLERRLAVAAAAARHHIDQGPAITAIYLPTLASGVDRALKFVTEHPLDLLPLQREHDREANLPGFESRNISVPTENLQYVRAWIATQPWGTSPSDKASPN